MQKRKTVTRTVLPYRAGGNAFAAAARFSVKFAETGGFIDNGRHIYENAVRSVCDRLYGMYAIIGQAAGFYAGQAALAQTERRIQQRVLFDFRFRYHRHKADPWAVFRRYHEIVVPEFANPRQHRRVAVGKRRQIALHFLHYIAMVRISRGK